MHYLDKREAKVKIMSKLVDAGWKVFGYSPDESDAMTDYYCPASWSGIAAKNGFVLVIDNNSTHYSGYEVKKYNYNKASYKASDRIVKLEAMMNDPASTENEKASCATLIEKEMEKANVEPTFTIEEVYPTFVHGNPKSANWHIEKDGQIIAKGNGAFSVNTYDWENEEVSAAEQKAIKLAKFIAKIEKVLTDSDALKAEIIKVAKTVTKPVEKANNEINEGDILSFSYHGGFWVVNSVYTTNGQIRISYESLGSAKRGYQRVRNAKRYYQTLDTINKQMEEGKAKIYTMQEVVEYQEKTVFKKTARKQTVSNAPAIETTEEVKVTANSNTEENEVTEPATSRQLWALHCATKLDTRAMKITKTKASELITKSKAGHSIIEEVKALIDVVMSEAVNTADVEPEQATEATVTTEPVNELEAQVNHDKAHNSEAAHEPDKVIYYDFGMMNKYYVGQKIKNSPKDDFPFFEIINISESLGGLKYYRVRALCDNELELVLHEEDLHPYNEKIKINNTEYQKIEENEEEKPAMTNDSFEDIFSKFENIDITAEQQTSSEDIEFCKEQLEIYRKLVTAHKNLIPQLQEIHEQAENHSKKYTKQSSGYTTAYAYSLKPSEIEKTIDNMKNKFISAVCHYFMNKYSVTINYESIQSKYKHDVTHEQIINEITNQLGGYNFQEKAEQEIKENLRESFTWKKAENKGKKMIMNNFLYIDTSWKKWGEEKIHYNSNDKLNTLFKALQHFENGSINMNEQLQTLYKQLVNGKNEAVFIKHELNFSKFKSIKIFKNGKVEIEFSTSQHADDFNKSYCFSNVA